MGVLQAFEAFWTVAAALGAIHSVRKNGAGASIVFLVPLFVWGFILEEATVVVIRGYYYPTGYSFYLLGVPLAITLGWVAMIYWSREATLALGEREWLRRLFGPRLEVVGLAASTAALATAFDALVLEPFANANALWVWTPPGAWFGTPFGNFVGWAVSVFTFVFFHGFLKLGGPSHRRHLATLALSLPLQLLLLQAATLSWVALVGYR